MTLIKRKVGEALIPDVQFNIYKFNTKLREEPKKTLILCCFSEFGCESIGAMYCIPRIIKENPSAYIIAVGWYGRSYLYQHLVDEFWELKEEYQFLRDKARAFHNASRNIAKIERSLSQYGFVVTSDKLGHLAVGNYCKKCRAVWPYYEIRERCPKCASLDVEKGLFADVAYWRKKALPIPKPSPEKMAMADAFLQRKEGERIVGIIARNRTTYGRNLPASFYKDLIELLQKKNYRPFWLGEKQSTLACPVEGIIDYSRMPESRDLELTLAVVSKLEFTVQFWTASTRLSAMVDTPYLIVESPDQVYGQGQEAFRMGLTTFGRKKLVLANYLKVFENQKEAIEMVSEGITEMEMGNWKDKIGMVECPEIIEGLREQSISRFGGA